MAARADGMATPISAAARKALQQKSAANRTKAVNKGLGATPISGPNAAPTPFYIASKTNTNVAPMSESSSAQRAAAGLAPTVHGGGTGIAGNASAQAALGPKLTQYTPNKAATIPTGGGAASTGSGGGGNYSGPGTPGSGGDGTTSVIGPPTQHTPTPTVTKPTPPPTTSGGTGGTVNASSSSGGRGNSMSRNARRTKRDNPRAARSTSIDELRKQAARQLGI